MFVTADYTYRQARSIPVGSDDARRIFGMSHQAYELLEYGCKIQDSISNGTVGFCDLSQYKLYRKPGPRLEIITTGQTLTLSNMALLNLRARQGGRLVDPGALCKLTDGPVSAGN